MCKCSNKICFTRPLAVSLYEAATGKPNRVCRIRPNTKCSRKKPGGIKRKRGKKSLIMGGGKKCQGQELYQHNYSNMEGKM